MKSLFHAILATIIISLGLLSSCAKESFQAMDVQTKNNGQNDGQGNGGRPTPPNGNLEEQVKNLDLSTYVFNGPFPTPDKGLLIANLDKTGEGQIYIRIPLGFSSLFTIGAGSHHTHKEITFAIEGNITTGFSLLVRIPLKFILRLAKFESAAPGRLPNGDVLPEVPSGELPMLNISVNPSKKEKIYLYLSKEYFGVLFESKFDLGVEFPSIPLKDKHDLRTVGFIHIIRPKNNSPGAFLVMLQFPPNVAALLDDYFLN